MTRTTFPSVPEATSSEGETLRRYGRILADVVAIGLAFLVAFLVYLAMIQGGVIDRPLPAPGPYIAIAAVFASVTCLVFWRRGLYGRRASVLNLWELETAVKGLVGSMAILFAIMFVLKLETYSRIVIVGSIILATGFVVLERRWLSALLRRFTLFGSFGQGVLIYGGETTGRLLMKKIVQSPHLGRTVIGFLDDHLPVGSLMCCRVTQTDPQLFEAPVLGRLENLQEIIEEHDPAEVLIVESSVGSDRLREALADCARLGLSVGVVPNLGDFRSDQLRVEDLSAIPVLRPAAQSKRRLMNAGKRVIDVLVSGTILLLTLPLWVPVVLAVRLDSDGPVLFRQKRIGRGGRAFEVLKFRTMHQDTPAYMSSPDGDDVDPRITRAGRFLRKFGLDELPQLVNVLKGDMSLVGPRPEMPQIVEGYTPLLRQRLEVKPGITGLWQVSADRHAQIHENVEYDLFYVQHQSLLLDALILLETLFFTVGLMLGEMGRRSEPIEAEEPAEKKHRLRFLVEPEPYVLVALDQRYNGKTPGSWTLCIPAACSLADRWPVRILSVRENSEVFERLVSDACGSGQARQISLARYSSRAELHRLVQGSRMVVSDLAHVVEWAREASIDTLEVVEGGVRWWSREGAADPSVLEMSRGLPLFTASELAEERHSPVSATAKGVEERLSGQHVRDSTESQ